MPRISQSSRMKRDRARKAVACRYARQNSESSIQPNQSLVHESQNNQSFLDPQLFQEIQSTSRPIFASFPGTLLPLHRFRENIPYCRPIVFRLLSIRIFEHFMGKLRMNRSNSIRHVCSICQISKSTLERWIYLTKINGIPSDFPSDTHAGRPPLLSDSQLALLDEFLQTESITSSLHQGRALNSSMILDWIQENLSVTVSRSTLQSILNNMGYSWSDPSLPDERASYNQTGHDRIDVVQYRQDTFIEIFLSCFRDPNVIFICQDESMIHCNQHSLRYYIKYDEKGKKWASKQQKSSVKKITKRGANYSVMVSCYMCEDEVHLECLKRIKRGGSNGRQTFNHQDFMDQFRSAIHYFKEKYPNKKLVFLFDNAPIHKVKMKGVEAS